MINDVIIDDQQGSIDVLVNHISKKNEISLAETFTNPLEALQFLERNRIDLVFIDMQMPHLTGLELIENLRLKKGNDIPKFIFTTGFNEYALDCFNQGVKDYLVKPIGFNRFNIAIDRIIEDLKPKSNLEKEFFFADTNGAKIKINFKDIIYIEGLGNYVNVIGNQLKFSIHRSLNSVLEILPGEQFVRVHKSFIVSIPFVHGVKGSELTFLVDTKEKKIPIGPTYKDVIFKRLGV
jgi:DNA-binding LytR/AlgR family response regulator